MRIEESDPNIFIGLNTSWLVNGCLRVFPHVADLWGSLLYEDCDNSPLKPWVSWGPLAQRLAIIRSLLCRSYYFSSDVYGLHEALVQVLSMLVGQAGFPFVVVVREARAWAKDWQPGTTGGSTILWDPRYVDVAISAVNKFLSRT